MSETFVLTSASDGIGRITMSEPARLNPVVPSRVAELVAACDAMSKDESVRVVIVTGAGRGFCSGADLTADLGTDITLAPGSGSVVAGSSGMWLLTSMRQPVIAQVNGAAVGFGAELALSADVRIAAESAKFRFPFSLLGTVSDTGAATWLLPRLIGWSRAAEILYSGRLIGAEEAAAIGLVNRVVPDAELAATVDELAGSWSRASSHSLQTMKQMIFAGLDERKGEHVLRQYYAFSQRDPAADMQAYFASVKGDVVTTRLS